MWGTRAEEKPGKRRDKHGSHQRAETCATSAILECTFVSANSTTAASRTPLGMTSWWNFGSPI